MLKIFKLPAPEMGPVKEISFKAPKGLKWNLWSDI
jgi:hypothetical protein